jgi:hypothetical protein
MINTELAIMHINPGDLVQRRNPQESKSFGIVINKKIANSGNNRSVHMKHIIGVCMHVCYVYFNEEGVTGPFYESDLIVKNKITPMLT